MRVFVTGAIAALERHLDPGLDAGSGGGLARRRRRVSPMSYESSRWER